MQRLTNAFRVGFGASFAVYGGALASLGGHRNGRTTSCSEVSPQDQARVKARIESFMRLANAGAGEELVGMLQDVEDRWWQRGMVHKIVLTGGPCAGKSTVLADLVQCLKEKNFLVLTMPEVATEMFHWSGGRMWDDFGEDGPMGDKSWAELQIMLTSVQISMEDSIESMAMRSWNVRRKHAKPPRGVVIILDRGVIDNKAYCTDEAWNIVLDQLGTTTARLRDRRYSHVIHMVTAANGAKEFYTTTQAEGGESARTETVEEAIALDQKIQEAWHGIQNLHIVGNDGSFTKKRNQVKDIVLQIVGNGPASHVVTKKYSCRYISAYELKRLAEIDENIHWPVLINTTLTHLGESHSLLKYATPGEANIYYHQTMDEHGSVFRMSQIDGWTYLQKTCIAKEAGMGELPELKEDLVMFTYLDSYFRCRCSTDMDEKPSLIVEVGVNPGDAIKKPQFPDWLKPIREMAVPAASRTS